MDFRNRFRNPTFTLGAEPLAYGPNQLLVPRLDALVHIFILRNDALPLRGQGGLAFYETVIIPHGMV